MPESGNPGEGEGADLGKKLRGDLYAGLYSKIGSI